MSGLFNSSEWLPNASLNGSGVAIARGSVNEEFSAVFIPIVAIVGWTGNSLVFITMRQREFRNQSMAICISALSVLDSLYLITVLYPHWFGLVIGYPAPSDCRAHLAVSATFNASRLWTVVTMCMDRCWKLFHPSEPSKFGVRRAMAIIASAVVLLFVLYSHYLFGRQADPTCPCKAEYGAFYTRVWPIVNLIIYFLLPLLLILAANVVLTVKTQQQSSILNNSGLQRAFKQRIKLEKTMNIVLLTVSVSILALTAPLTIFEATPKHQPSVKLKYSEYSSSEFIFMQLMTVSSAINFFLYSLTSPVFRLELIKWLTKRRHPPTISALYTIGGIRIDRLSH